MTCHMAGTYDDRVDRCQFKKNHHCRKMYKSSCTYLQAFEGSKAQRSKAQGTAMHIRLI
jgi:hypothetical protein